MLHLLLSINEEAEKVELFSVETICNKARAKGQTKIRENQIGLITLLIKEYICDLFL